jgi:hypothetical protein
MQSAPMSENSSRSNADPQRAVDDSLADHISQNVGSILALHRRESQTMTPAQRRLERVGRFVGRPLFLIGVIVFVAVWVAFNWLAPIVHFTPFDPPPFAWLDQLSRHRPQAGGPQPSSPGVLTFGSAHNRDDFTAGAEARLGGRLYVLGGYPICTWAPVMRARRPRT